jgi:hypothetical protein
MELREIDSHDTLLLLQNCDQLAERNRLAEFPPLK